MTQQHTQDVSERLSAKLRAFFDTLEPDEKVAMADYLSRPIGGEDVKGYELGKEFNPMTAEKADGILSSVIFDLAGSAITVDSVESVADSVTKADATTQTTSFERL